MKYISLTQDKFAIVDDEDFEWLNQWKWFAWFNRGRWYARRRNGKSCQSMHRLILGLKPGDKRQVDHINGGGLDNERQNIRICTCQQNCQNRRAATKNIEGYKGVRWDEQKQKWTATIQCSFDSKESAAKAYNLMAQLMFGEFARLNDVA